MKMEVADMIQKLKQKFMEDAIALLPASPQTSPAEHPWQKNTEPEDKGE